MSRAVDIQCAEPLTGVRTPRSLIYMETTATQNAAHRNDIAWTKTSGKSFKAGTESYISEYVNPWTGQAIRKSWRMTGADWFVFDAAGNITGRSHSLTWAKFAAAEMA